MPFVVGQESSETEALDGMEQATATGGSGGVDVGITANRNASFKSTGHSISNNTHTSANTKRRKSRRRKWLSIWGRKNPIVKLYKGTRYILEALRAHPKIFFKSLIVLALVCGVGVGLIVYASRVQEANIQSNAQALAVETGRWFCKYSGNIPLFGLIARLYC